MHFTLGLPTKILSSNKIKQLVLIYNMNRISVLHYRKMEKKFYIVHPNLGREEGGEE